MSALASSALKAAIESIRSGDRSALLEALAREPELARRGRLVVAAAGRADLAALRLLLARGADPDAAHRGYRALHALIQERPEAQAKNGAGRHACLDLLLERGASPELCGAYPPASALLVAAFAGEGEIAKRLVAAGARVDEFASSALGRVRRMERALEQSPELARARSEGGLTPLHCCAASRLGRGRRAVARDLLAVAALLLDAGADPSARVKSWSEEVDAAALACGAENRELLSLLLDRGADPTAALPAALRCGTEALAELVLARGALIDRARAGGNPLLNEMIRWGRVQEALWLLERGASPDLSGRGGFTALHQAASRGNARLVAALLAAGADRERQDSQGRTALDLARRKGRRELVALLS